MEAGRTLPLPSAPSGRNAAIVPVRFATGGCWNGRGADWQISAEAAFNSLDNISHFFVLKSSGEYEEIPLPGGTGTVPQVRPAPRGFGLAPGAEQPANEEPHQGTARECEQDRADERAKVDREPEPAERSISEARFDQIGEQCGYLRIIASR